MTKIIRTLCESGEEKELTCFELKKILCIQLAQDLKKLFDAYPKGETNHANNSLVQVLTKIRNVIHTPFDNEKLLFENISQSLYNFFLESTKNNPGLFTERTNALREDNNHATLLGKIIGTLLMFGISNKLNYDKLDAICGLKNKPAQQTNSTSASETNTPIPVAQASQTRAVTPPQINTTPVAPAQQTNSTSPTPSSAPHVQQINSASSPESQTNKPAPSAEAPCTRTVTPPPQTNSIPSSAAQAPQTNTIPSPIAPPQTNTTSPPVAQAQQTRTTPSQPAPQIHKPLIYINAIHFHAPAAKPNSTPSSPAQQTPDKGEYSLFQYPMLFTPPSDKKPASSDIELQAAKLSTALADHKQPLSHAAKAALLKVAYEISQALQEPEEYTPISPNMTFRYEQ